MARKTPVALTTLGAVAIEERVGTADLPKVLETTPGVYVMREGGGYGDTKVNMRGFKSENVAVLVNGVSMNDMEWGVDTLAAPRPRWVWMLEATSVSPAQLDQ